MPLHLPYLSPIDSTSQVTEADAGANEVPKQLMARAPVSLTDHALTDQAFRPTSWPEQNVHPVEWNMEHPKKELFMNRDDWGLSLRRGNRELGELRALRSGESRSKPPDSRCPSEGSFGD